MQAVRPHPRARTIRLVALLFLPLGLVAGAVLITLPQRMNELALASAEERASGLARVMASLVAPDLEFEDREHAREALARLEVEPDLLGAELVGPDGERFAAGPAACGAPAPPGSGAPEPSAGHVRVDEEWIDVSAPVRAAGGTRGVLRLRLATTGVAEKRRANVALAGVAAGIVALVGLFFSAATARFLVRRQAAVEALRRSADSVATLSDSLPVALVMHRNDRILYVNPAGAKLLDGEERSLVGASLSAQLAVGEKLPEPNGQARAGLDARTLSLASGAKLNVEAASIAIQFGEAASSALVALDVTERTRMQERLLLSDRMASLGTLTAGVAHEINNPLSVVIANLEFVRDSLGAEESTESPAADQAEALSEGLDAAHRVGRIVKDMKALSRSDDDALVATDLDQAIEKSLQMVQGHLKHRAQVVRRLGGVPPVTGNESRLVQVFVNLLINAAQALPEGKATEHRIEVSTWTEGSSVVATVRDTGHGIPAAVRDRIFDPFFTTKPVGVGTGLGLAIVHNLVQAMDGRIEVDSAEGGGTTFTIRLRIAPQAGRVRGSSTGVLSAVRGSILVIDDEATVANAVERLLADTHAVSAVHSARVALDRFGRGESFDVILCDLRMPDMSGLELARQLDARFPDLRRRLLFMTGDIGQAGMSAPDAAPVDPASIAPVLEKPFSRRALLQFIARKLDRDLDEPPSA